MHTWSTRADAKDGKWQVVTVKSIDLSALAAYTAGCTNLIREVELYVLSTLFTAPTLEIDVHAASLALQSIDHDSPQLYQFLLFCGATTEYLSSILMMSENTLKLAPRKTHASSTCGKQL
jgi:hypothetical protein